MVFSSTVFLFYFLPVTLAVYYLIVSIKGSMQLKNLTLLIASLIFYMWGEPVYIILMIGQCTVSWIFGLIIQMQKNQKCAKAFMIVSVTISLSGLIFFKYTDFFISGLNILPGINIPGIGFLLPIGISFYTFQIISYIVDLYNKKIEAQKNVLYFSMYVASFPQLIAGPIVRYTDIAQDIISRDFSISNFSHGARRFIIGLGKKVLLANTIGQLVEIYKISGDGSVLFTWLYIIAFALQIYFDFSGYSDMAIGLGKIFGFKFPENFNYPYIAGCITDFWRRWHMTLSAWFRDYVYIPLGGNRAGTLRNISCLMFVWMITGFWHGADWNFIFWGGYFGALLIFEKFLLFKVLNKTPVLIRHTYTLLSVLISWVFFDASSIEEAVIRVGRIFGAGADTFASSEALYYLRSFSVPILAGIIASTPLARKAVEKLECRKGFITVAEPVAIAVIFIFSTAAIINGSFNPFIYFRF